jgi:hypothetical protein
MKMCIYIFNCIFELNVGPPYAIFEAATVVAVSIRLYVISGCYAVSANRQITILNMYGVVAIEDGDDRFLPNIDTYLSNDTKAQITGIILSNASCSVAN